MGRMRLLMRGNAAANKLRIVTCDGSQVEENYAIAAALSRISSIAIAIFGFHRSNAV